MSLSLVTSATSSAVYTPACLLTQQYNSVKQRWWLKLKFRQYHRLIQGPGHPSFGLVKCTVGRVYPSNSASWTGFTRPRCTEYDRASTSFRRYCANSARRKSPHVQVSSRVIGQAVLRSELRCAAASHWSRHGQSMECGVKLQYRNRRVLLSMTGLFRWSLFLNQ